MITDWENFCELVMEAQDFDDDFFLGHDQNTLTLDAMRTIIDLHCTKANQWLIDSVANEWDRLQPEWKGQFHLFGMDYMIDSRGKFWFIECNSKPDLDLFGTPKIK